MTSYNITHNVRYIMNLIHMSTDLTTGVKRIRKLGLSSHIRLFLDRKSRFIHEGVFKGNKGLCILQDYTNDSCNAVWKGLFNEHLQFRRKMMRRYHVDETCFDCIYFIPYVDFASLVGC